MWSRIKLKYREFVLVSYLENFKCYITFNLLPIFFNIADSRIYIHTESSRIFFIILSMIVTIIVILNTICLVSIQSEIFIISSRYHKKLIKNPTLKTIKFILTENVYGVTDEVKKYYMDILKYRADKESEYTYLKVS